MSIEFDIYTGTLIYKEIEFSFVFDRGELRLIPPKDKDQEVHMWFMKSLGKGAYTFGDPVYVEDDYLIGNCNENCQKIIFLPKHKNIGSYNSVLIVQIEAYIIQKYERDWIDRLGFMSQELDCIYSTSQALESPEWTEDGVVSVKTKDFDNTTSHKQCFSVDGKEVSVFFGISRTGSGKVGKPPLELHSEMFFEFEKTNDYAFVLKLWRIAKCFVQYLCYRKNVNLSSVEISTPYGEGKHEKFAVLHIVNEDVDNEPETLEKRRYIKQEYISGAEGKILNDIAEDRIYLRHIPETYRAGKSINAARFVMITAAFEWTFKKNYPDGITKKSATIKAEKIATEVLNGLVNDSKGKLREIYKFLRKLIGSNSLQNEIEQAGKDYADIVDIFGKHLYSMNNEKLKYSEMGLRLSQQRNNFAHGNLDKDFIGLSLLDLIYLEYIVYAMQLKEYGVKTTFIQQAINDLFGCSIALQSVSTI